MTKAPTYQPQSQAGWLDLWDSTARRTTQQATDILAERLGIPGVDAADRTGREPVPTRKSIGHLEHVAILAQAVVRLTEEVDELRVQLAANGGDRS
jgi:hypothetical protein